MIADTRSRTPVATAPATKMAGRITAVVINRKPGIFRKHARVRFSPATTTWEISMTYASYDRRPTALIRPTRRLVRQPGQDSREGNPRTGHGGHLLLSTAREPAPMRTAPAAWSPLAVKAASLCCCAGNALPSLLLAILSWAITEVLAGCAAYAEAMYATPAPAAAETNGPTSVPLRAKPVLSLVSAPTRHGAAPAHRGAAAAVAALPAEWQRHYHDVEVLDVEVLDVEVLGEMHGEVQRELWPTRTASRLSPKFILTACWTRLWRARARRRAIEELRGLDDHTLRDIGISRADIEDIVQNGVRRE
jgi:uncharacterized protein YjiS (DUF1127 family)